VAVPGPRATLRSVGLPAPGHPPAEPDPEWVVDRSDHLGGPSSITHHTVAAAGDGLDIAVMGSGKATRRFLRRRRPATRLVRRHRGVGRDFDVEGVDLKPAVE
jgi:hypothetical protein